MVTPMPTRSPAWTCIVVLLAVACKDDTIASTIDDTTGSATTDAPSGSDTSGNLDESSTGNDTGETPSTSDDSTTETSLCGNGELDPGEECDDGNDEWLDACRPDCTWSFEELWTHSYDGPAGTFDGFSDVVVDDGGTIHVVGWHVVEGSRREFLIKTYDPDGDEGWTFSYQGQGDEHDYGEALALHPSGDLIACGTTTTIDHGIDFVVMRVSPGADAPVWVREYSGPSEGTGFDACTGVAVDADGAIVAIGRESIGPSNWDIVVRKHDADGDLLWSRSHGDPFGGPDLGMDVAIADDGDIVVLGRVREAQGLQRTWIRRYDASGDEQWTYRSGTDGSPNWYGGGIAVDPAGDLLVSGSDGSGLIATKLDPAAAPIWRAELSNNGFAHAVASPPSGDVVVAGEINTATAGFEVWVGGLDSAGQPRWGFTYGNEVAKLNDWANGVAVAADGDVVVVGVETVIGQQTNGWIRKIRPAS